MNIIILPSLNGGKNIDVAPASWREKKRQPPSRREKKIEAREKMNKAKIDAREQQNNTTEQQQTPLSCLFPIAKEPTHSVLS
jgi:hypothetical protein